MPDAPSSKLSGYRVGDITIDLARRRVSRNGAELKLGKLSFRLLVALAQSAPNVLTRDELAERVWRGRFVSPPTIKQRIVLLRQALGDDANEPRYINVVRGHGYSAIPEVELLYETRPARWPFRPIYQFAALGGIVVAAVIYLASIAIAPNDDVHTLAILPFENLSPAPADAYLATGLHEEIIERLAQIDGLQVVSRTSVQRYSGSPTAIRDIARELDVDAVMEGTVNFGSGKVRIGARLVEPESGIQLWSNSYEREFSNILDIQREIATSVAGALSVTLGVRESNAFRGAGTTSIEAYEAFLTGLHFLGQAQGQDRAIFFFQRATELDPDYAAAWAQMGFAIAARSFYAPAEHTADILDRAMPPLQRALELDPQSARVAAMSGFIRYSRRDWIGAEKDHTRAIALHASHETLSQHAGMLIRAGRVTAARSEFDAAESLQRYADQRGLMQTQVHIAQGRYAEARAFASRENVAILRQRLLLNIALNEGNRETIKQAMAGLMAVESASSPLFAALLPVLDSRDAALAVIQAVQDDDQLQWPAKDHDIALLAAYLGDPQLAIEAISRDVGLSTVRLWALWYPVMSGVRQSFEFKELVADLNLVTYWRTYGWADACTPLGESDFRCS